MHKLYKGLPPGQMSQRITSLDVISVQYLDCALTDFMAKASLLVRGHLADRNPVRISPPVGDAPVVGLEQLQQYPLREIIGVLPVEPLAEDEFAQLPEVRGVVDPA